MLTIRTFSPQEDFLITWAHLAYLFSVVSGVSVVSVASARICLASRRGRREHREHREEVNEVRVVFGNLLEVTRFGWLALPRKNAKQNLQYFLAFSLGVLGVLAFSFSIASSGCRCEEGFDFRIQLLRHSRCFVVTVRLDQARYPVVREMNTIQAFVDENRHGRV